VCARTSPIISPMAGCELKKKMERQRTSVGSAAMARRGRGQFATADGMQQGRGDDPTDRA
jgi:hypothetical protein